MTETETDMSREPLYPMGYAAEAATRIGTQNCRIRELPLYPTTEKLYYSQMQVYRHVVINFRFAPTCPILAMSLYPESETSAIYSTSLPYIRQKPSLKTMSSN